MFEKWKDIFKRLAGEGVYPHELAFLLDSPVRKLILSPSKLVDRFHLKSDSVVLEIGSGPGYFSIETAKRIPDGCLVLFDIQNEMLAKCKTKLIDENIVNTFPVQGDAKKLPFNNNVFDVVFMVTVLGEVGEPVTCLESINKTLRIGGLLSITEMRGDADFLTKENIIEIVIANGFEYLEEFSSKTGSTYNFRKKYSE